MRIVRVTQQLLGATAPAREQRGQSERAVNATRGEGDRAVNATRGEGDRAVSTTHVGDRARKCDSASGRPCREYDSA